MGSRQGRGPVQARLGGGSCEVFEDGVVGGRSPLRGKGETVTGRQQLTTLSYGQWMNDQHPSLHMDFFYFSGLLFLVFFRTSFFRSATLFSFVFTVLTLIFIFHHSIPTIFKRHDLFFFGKRPFFLQIQHNTLAVTQQSFFSNPLIALPISTILGPQIMFQHAARKRKYVVHTMQLRPCCQSLSL